MQRDDRFHHHPKLKRVAGEDVRFVLEKDRSYGASWKASGGRSAWFMLRRKIDRLLEMMRDPPWPESTSLGDLSEIADQPAQYEGHTLTPELAGWLVEKLTAEDIFAKIAADPSGADGTVLAEVRDLRRYLMLVEAEMIARGAVEEPKITLSSQSVEPDDVHSILARGNQIERDYYMLRAQEWAVEPDQAREVCGQMEKLGALMLDSPISRTHNWSELHKIIARISDALITSQTPVQVFTPGPEEVARLEKLRASLIECSECGGIGCLQCAGTGRVPRATGPGTPEDGGHHARMPERLDDGVERQDHVEGIHYTAPGANSEPIRWIVDRRVTPADRWDHLPRLPLEANNKEHEETPVEYRGLYEWKDSKWRMRRQFVEHWGREP